MIGSSDFLLCDSEKQICFCLPAVMKETPKGQVQKTGSSQATVSAERMIHSNSVCSNIGDQPTPDSHRREVMQ